jgi:hypothetical protein
MCLHRHFFIYNDIKCFKPPLDSYRLLVQLISKRFGLPGIAGLANRNMRQEGNIQPQRFRERSAIEGL